MEAPPSPLSSRPGFPVTQHRTRQRVRLSVRKSACSSRNPPTSTGNPGSVPGFPTTRAKDDLVCGFHQGKPHELCGTIALPFVIRAQPRDLQFRGPFLEMFFDRAIVQTKSRLLLLNSCGANCTGVLRLALDAYFWCATYVPGTTSESRRDGVKVAQDVSPGYTLD